VVILVGTIGMVSYRRYVQKKKDSELLAKQKKEITDSILYASLIQKSTLPTKEYVESVLPYEHFVYFKPRDIVSGDFYWIDWTADCIIVAVADCTGHGVPGAIVSMLGIAALNKVSSKMKEPKADLLLNELRKEVIRQLNPIGSANERADGLDIALTVIHKKSRKIEFAGAYMPLYLIRDGELIVKKANRMPIGLYVKNDEPFTAHRINFQPDDVLYLTSDGYASQFGGIDNTTFKTKNLKNLLLKINQYPMDEQARILDETHNEWKRLRPQVDDILILGIKLS
jgi:serine phosphatase RsbU (regulator of sigma subunit)